MSDRASRPPYPPKVTFYQSEEETDRMRAAFVHTREQEGERSLSQFIQHAVMLEVWRREQLYNDGAPFEHVPAGVIPRGRPHEQ